MWLRETDCPYSPLLFRFFFHFYDISINRGFNCFSVENIEITFLKGVFHPAEKIICSAENTDGGRGGNFQRSVLRIANFKACPDSPRSQGTSFTRAGIPRASEMFAYVTKEVKR